MTMHERSHFLVNVARLCLAVEILLDVRFRWTFRSLGFFCLAYSSVVRLDHYFIILYLSRASCTRALLLLCAFGKAANDLPRVLDFNVVSWKSNSCAVYLQQRNTQKWPVTDPILPEVSGVPLVVAVALPLKTLHFWLLSRMHLESPFWAMQMAFVPSTSEPPRDWGGAAL